MGAGTRFETESARFSQTACRQCLAFLKTHFRPIVLELRMLDLLDDSYITVRHNMRVKYMHLRMTWLQH